jgi:phosphate-selective porin OprO/OprP
VRLGVEGTFNFKRPWIYTFVLATHVFDKGFDYNTYNKVTLLDYRLNIPIWNQKEPISMARLLLGTQLQMQERPSGVDAMFPARNTGIALNGNLFSQRISWAAGVFNDWYEDKKRFKESSTHIIGRISGIPLINENESQIIHLGLGISYNNGRESLRYYSSPEFNQSPVFVNTDTILADNAIKYDVEISWRSGPLWISSEIILQEMNAPMSGDPFLYGFHISGSYVLTGEMRSYVILMLEQYTGRHDSHQN